MAAGAHAVTVTPVGGSALDLSCWVTTVDIAHGRDDPTSQPDADSATLEIIVNDFTGPLPAAVEIGSALTVTTYASGAHRRFTGTISDINLGWENAPDDAFGQLIAVGVLGRLGRRVVGAAAWPQELDGARVSRVMAAAGVTLNPATSDPGTVQVLARPIDLQPALDISQATAQSASGIVWNTRDGEVRYADAAHRKGIAPILTLDACDLLETPTWRRTTEGMTNDVSVTYGVDATAGTYAATNAPSIAKYGTYAYSISTILAAAGDAAALGQLYLVRNGVPVWVMADLPIDMEHIDATRYAQLLDLEMHSLITLTGLPAVATAPTSAQLWVEGWRESLANGEHSLSLVVTGYCRTVPAPQWDTTDPAWTWNTVPATLTWDDTTCLGPPVNYGRWNDQPASLRWNKVDPAKTWDTYA